MKGGKDMDNMIPNSTRFVGATSSVITFTKWHDLKTGEFWFDLYINGKVEGHYRFSDLIKKLQEVAVEL